MVTFVCNECGASCRKNAVEKHGFKCRFNSLSCIDCNKDFTRTTYQEHNQCITENQKYGGKDYVEKPNCDKGKKKQDQWLTNIENYVASGGGGNMSHHLNAILGYPNVPRKWKKFDNFARNCLRIMHPDQVQQLWNAIEAANQVGATSNNSHVTNAKNSCQNGAQVDQSEAMDATLSQGSNGTKAEEDSGKADEVVDQKKAKEKKKDKKRKKEAETQNEVIPSANEVCEFNEETLKKPKLEVNEEMIEKKEKKRRKEKDEKEEKRKKDEEEEKRKKEKDEEEEEEKSDVEITNETNQNVSTENMRIEMDLNVEKEKKFQFKKEMLKLIKENENQEVSLEVMKNKIYKLVKKFEGKKNSREEIYNKVDKIITGSKRFLLDNQIVKLKHSLL